MIRRTNFVFVVILLFLTIQQTAWSQSSQRSELLLPPTTRAWLSIPNVDGLVDSIEKTSFGRMLNDEKISPFVEDLAAQIRSWLDEKNVQFGLQIEDFEGIPSGEICVAGILIEANPAAGPKAKPDHATVLLVDITSTHEESAELLTKIEKNLGDSGATNSKLEIGGIEVSKWDIDKPHGLVGQVHAYHCIVGNWLVTCDNERIVRDIIRRIQVEDLDKANLASSPTFVKVQQQCGFDEGEKHLRWYIEPFGYIELAQAIAADQNPNLVESNDFAKIFREEGFSAIKGLGGTVKVYDEKHDLVHRSFIYAPPVEEAGDDRYLRAAGLLDFTNSTGSDLAPPDWVPNDSASYFSFTWNLAKALEKVGFIVESVGGRPGSWETTLDQLKNAVDGPKVDIRLLVKQLEPRISVIAATEKPITEASERVVFGINITGDPEIVKIHASKLILQLEAEVETSIIKHGEHNLWVADTSVQDSDVPDIFIDEDDPLGLDKPEPKEVAEEIKKPKPLFERRVGTVVGGVLLVGNDVEYMKKVIDQMEDKPGRVLETADDYSRITAALTELSKEFEGESVIRHFGRLDAGLETNYEMLRQGKMGSSKTIFAQILNQSIKPDEADEPRTQKINPDKMPADYQADVARYLGPNGMIVKEAKDGWVVLGCVLPKKESVASVAKKNDEPTTDDKATKNKDDNLNTIKPGDDDNSEKKDSVEDESEGGAKKTTPETKSAGKKTDENVENVVRTSKNKKDD